LGLYLAGKYNAVSVDHGLRATEIFREKYGHLYYGHPIDFAPITNGIYEKRWNKPMVSLLEKNHVLDTFGLVGENTELNITSVPAEKDACHKN